MKVELIWFKRVLVWLIPALLTLGGCSRRDYGPSSTYYDRHVAPTLQGACVRSPTGSSCHVTADTHGNALGNLDTSGYNMLAKRRDLLQNYGPYGMPELLVKVVPPFQMQLTAWDGTVTDVTTDIPHAGGSLLDFGAASFVTISRWLDRGAQANNVPPRQPKLTLSPCRDRLGHDKLFDPSVAPSTADYSTFVDKVNDVLSTKCAAGNCHGSAENSFYLTCGTSDEEKRWNYFAASDYVAANAPTSELLRRALDPAYGGTYHEGGAFFSSPQDPDYQAVLTWAKKKGGPSHIPTDAGFDFFAKRVQPLFAKKGCMLLGCHSPAAFNSFRLRAGSAGHFGLPATRNNYHAALAQVALESPDPNRSRILQKNLPPYPAGAGIRHRGGSLFAAGGDPSACDLDAARSGPLDQQDPYCVLVAWIEKERAARTPALAPMSAIVYVKRPPAPLPDRPQDYATYAPGADLRIADASLDASGALVMGGGDRSLLAGCGLDPATADVRRPAVSWDGKLIAFAARSAAAGPLRVYTVLPDGSDCKLDPMINAAPTDDNGKPVPDNGELVHNFDPAFAPDGSLVFASTRGNTKNTAAFDYQGPQRTPADPSKLNANLYVKQNGHVRQLTFLLNQEIAPSFEVNGQLLFSAEKRAPGFYQLAGRRLNLDGGDYHLLFGQRGSIGHDQVLDLVQLLDRDFAAILSDRGAAHSAGTVVVLNRSLGPDQYSKSAEDYPANPDAMHFVSPAFFQHSMTFPDAAATGHVGKPTQGAYRDLSVLPNGNLLVSYAGGVTDLAKFNGGFDVVELDPVSGQRAPLFGAPDTDELWPVAVFGRVDRGVFHSTPKAPAGSAVIYTQDDGQPRIDRAQLTYMDFPMITSLMFQNTRGGRPMQPMTSFQLWEDLPPKGVTSLDQSSPFITSDDYGKVYARRRLLGSVPLLADGSTRVQIPGGMPISYAVEAKLEGDDKPRVHQQRESIQYYPGEWVTLSFRHEMFNGFCGGCHGSLSGMETDVSVKPDILTKASSVEAKSSDAVQLLQRGAGSGEVPAYP